MSDADENIKAELPLGYRGAVTVVIHPAIRLRPTKRVTRLHGSLTPGLTLSGTCDNLEGPVPCTLTWLVKRGTEEAEIAEKRKAELRGSGGKYEVWVDGQPLSSVSIFDLNLLGRGEIGYRIRPATPRNPLVVKPHESGITFDYPFTFAAKRGAKVGEVLRIDPTDWPAELNGHAVRLTLCDSDDAARGKPFEWKLNEPHPENGATKLEWYFGCNPKIAAGEAITLEYCDHFESDANLEYGVRIEVLNKLSSEKGKKPEVKASLELKNLWTGAVPALDGFSLAKESSLLGDLGVGEVDERFEAKGSLTGFDPHLELRFEVDLWASNGSEVRRAEDVLAELRALDQSSPSGVPRALERQFELAGTRHAISVKSRGGKHVFEERVFDIDELLRTVDDVDAAKEVLAPWSVFAELRLSPDMTGGAERPMMQVARFGGELVGVDHGVIGRRHSAVGVGSQPISFAGILSRHKGLSDAEQFDACVLAMCIYTEARDNADAAKRRREMLHVGGCVQNRVITKYRGNSFYEVVLSTKQYSHFNKDSAEKTALLEAHKAGDKVDPIVAWASKLTGGNKAAWEMALSVAEELVGDPGKNPFKDGAVRHYYSPRSMDPPGSKPDWAVDDKKIKVDEIPEDRFVWFKGVL